MAQKHRANAPQSRVHVSKTRHLRRGAAAVELALLLPVLVTFVVGAIDFGRFAHTYIAVGNAARAGAAFGSFNSYTTNSQAQWEAGIKGAINDEMNQLLMFDTSKVATTISNTTETDGLRRISVTVSYPFTTVVTWGYIPALTNLQRTIVLRSIR